MSKEIVLDIETKNTFADVGGVFHDKLQISVVGIYDYATDEYIAYREEQLGDLWSRLEHAERIIGYNIKAFDFPVMQTYYRGDIKALPCLDMLEIVRGVLGFRPKLDDLAFCTLQQRKSADGLQAVEFFRRGEWEKLIQYCLDDVRITRDVYEFGKRRGEVFYSNRNGISSAKVDFLLPETAHAVNLTLPL